MKLLKTKVPEFENSYLDQLPVDQDLENRPRQVYEACATSVQPRGFANPALIAFNEKLSAQLGLASIFAEPRQAARVFSGNHLLPGMRPYAMRYGGHQFGSWAGQLGDGRAINLGEVLDDQGARQCLQLKGAGPTPYSRNGDGLAVLRSSVREYLCSEAMQALSIPTTRALSLVLSGENVVRDMFYDGNPKLEPGAIVCRVSPTFVRFGHFEILAANQEFELQKQLADYIIKCFYPDLSAKGDAIYKDWFTEIAQRSLRMVLEWQRVGFVHGVMNTDNMSIIGETIDYGPYGWLEDFDPGWTPNTTDAQGRRYCFGNQPAITHWNLTMLANALYNLIDDREFLEGSLRQWEAQFQNQYLAMLLAKIGFCAWPAIDGELQQLFSKQDRSVWIEFSRQTNALFSLRSTDYIIVYHLLSSFDFSSHFDGPEDEQQSLAQLSDLLSAAWYGDSDNEQEYQRALLDWSREYSRLLRAASIKPEKRKENMRHCNPVFVLRNYMAQEAIELAEQGDYTRIAELYALLQNPYADPDSQTKGYFQKRPSWANHKPGCAMLSCSS